MGTMSIVSQINICQCGWTMKTKVMDDETQIVLNMLGVKETNYTRVDFI